MGHCLCNSENNDGRWQTLGLSQVEGHFPRNTGVLNVTSGKESPLGSVSLTDAAVFKIFQSLLWNI